jgi:hypothetical protein
MIEAEFHYLLPAKRLKLIEELFTMRARYPFTAEQAPTTRDRAIASTLDGAIMTELLALRVMPTDGGGFCIAPPSGRNVGGRATAGELSRLAKLLHEAAKLLEASPEAAAAIDQRAREEEILEEVLDVGGRKLYELFAGDDESRLDFAVDADELPWWEVIGYTSFADWLDSR